MSPVDTDTNRPAVLLVNPNTNSGTTEMMRSLAASHLPHSQVLGATAAAGPSMITDPQALAESEPHVIEAVRTAMSTQRIDAVIVAAVGDPGRSALEGALEIPVVGIGQASVLAASAGGRRFGMATSTPLLVDSLTALAHAHARASLFTGVEVTASPPLELAGDPERQYRELEEAVRECVAGGAQSVIIAGGPLSRTARRLATQGIATIIEPVPSACALVSELLAATAGTSTPLWRTQMH